MRWPETANGKVDALVIDADQRQALVVMRELGQANLGVCAVESQADAPAFASRWCTVSAVLPDFARRPDAFIDALLEVCAKHRPRVLIPSHDGSIEALRHRRVDVERAVGLALASEEALAIAVDKARTLVAASTSGLRVPRGVLVSDITEAERALDDVGLPVVVKPTRSWVQGSGYGQRLIPVLATTRTAALAAIDAVLAENLQAAVQEWLPGDREAVSFFYAHGRVWARFAQRATRAVPLLGGASVRRESIPLPANLTEDAERLVIELNLEGYSEVEFRRDAEGRAALMEINPRLSASVEVAVRAGIPFPRLLYDWASEGRLQEQSGYRVGVHMRWLGGDLSWLKKVWTQQGQPDTPPRGRALRVFFADFLHPLNYDYVDVRDPRPAFQAAVGVMRKAWRQRANRQQIDSRRPDSPQIDNRQVDGRLADRAVSGRAELETDVAVIGAGPYGLSIAAHLSGRGISHEIFGETMDTWSSHMPMGMCLKSEGFASNISDPAGECTLKRFCAEHGLEYGDVGVPVSLDTFERYGCCFQERFVPVLGRQAVERVRPTAGGFELRLSTGETLHARRVIVASGVQGYAHLPPKLRGLPLGTVVHSYDQLDPTQWTNLRVAVVGAGQSALDAAVLLHESGADVVVLARASSIVWNPDPVLGPRPLRARIRYPNSGLGNGLKMRIYASHPLVMHAAPTRQRLRIAYTALGPAGAWWLRPRFEGQVNAFLEHTIQAARMEGEEVRLRLQSPAGEEELTVARVLAGTGYRVDLHRLSFLDSALRARVATAASAPVLDRSFQSSVPGLYFVGYAAAGSFGPVMRFVYGADFTARQLARELA